jgi:S-adenosylmethionine:tRNA ribosyltransferase-isomerase
MRRYIGLTTRPAACAGAVLLADFVNGSSRRAGADFLGALGQQRPSDSNTIRGVQRHDFAYDLPPELIAQTPLAERSASRLLVVEPAHNSAAAMMSLGPNDQLTAAVMSMGPSDKSSPAEASASAAELGSNDFAPALSTASNRAPTVKLGDCTMRDFPSLLRPGDLLVFNDTKVVAARLAGTKPSGGRVEIFLERVIAEAENEALVQLRASKPIREGLEVTTVGGIVRILGRQDDLWRVGFPGSALEFFERWGDVPLPPYIQRTPDANDRERYQSIFARERGAVAAPTASLHFDSELIRRIEEMGVGRAFVTLHVGAGTFQPMRVDDLDAHVMHAERVTVGATTCAAIERTRAEGGRVIAIGTTVIRALESAALAISQPIGAIATASSGGWSGDTRLFIRPGFRFQVADALLTNFHLPESTLLMLVCAFAGMTPVIQAYEHAVREKYRFFSYGDAMFLTRKTG